MFCCMRYLIYTYLNILLKTSFATVVNMYLFFLNWGKNETNIHLEEPFYLLTKTWKYGGCVFGPAVAG